MATKTFTAQVVEQDSASEPPFIGPPKIRFDIWVEGGMTEVVIDHPFGRAHLRLTPGTVAELVAVLQAVTNP